MIRLHHRYVTILFIFLFLVLFAFASPRIVLSRSHHYADSDFFSFWLASKMTWEGQNPFNPEVWIEGHYNHGATWISDNTFLYPPGLSVILAPIGLLPLFNAYVVWVFLSMSFLLASLIVLLSNWLNPSSLMPFLVPMIIGALLFRPFIATLLHGQLGALLLLVLILAICLLEKEKWLSGGILLGITLFKPNLGLLIIAIVGFYALITRRWRLFTGLVLGSISVYIISQIRVQDWLSQYIHILSDKGNQTLGYSPTLWGIMSLACKDDPTCVMRSGSAVSIIVLLCILILIIRKKDTLSPYIVVSIAISTMVLVTPYLWGYDQILLLVPIFVLSMDLKKMGYPYIVTVSLPLAFSLLATLLAYIGTLLLRDTASILLSLPLFITMIWLCSINPQRLLSQTASSPIHPNPRST